MAEDESEELNSSHKRTSRSTSSPFRSYFVNYELKDLEKELEKIDKEALDLERQLRHAMKNGEHLNRKAKNFFLTNAQ